MSVTVLRQERQNEETVSDSFFSHVSFQSIANTLTILRFERL